MPSLPAKPAPGSTVNTGHALASGLVRCCLLNEGSGSAQELIGSAFGALTGGAAWATDATLGGACVDFASSAAAYIDYGNDGFSHGNGNVSVFFGLKAKVNSAFHWAGAIAGTSVDTYSFGIHDANTWTFTIRNVAHIQNTNAAIDPVDAVVYTVGMAFTKGVGARFHIFDWTNNTQLTPESVSNAGAPGISATPSVLGNIDNLDASLRNPLAFLYIKSGLWSDADFVSMHASPYAFINSPSAGNYVLVAN